MKPRPVIDVSELPTTAFAARDPVFWGVVGLVLIETTMFSLCWASYLYLRGNLIPFPPNPIPRIVVAAGGLELLLLLATAYPMHRSNKAAERHSLHGMRRNVAVVVVLQLAVAALRAWTFAALPFRWDSHAHGSLFWFTIGMHTLHLVWALIEFLVLLAVLFKGPVEEKHCVDVHVNGLYWFVVIAWWIPTWALFYVDPILFPRGGMP